MARMLKLLNLSSELTPHSLRHTHTSLLAETKVGLDEIMDCFGQWYEETTKNLPSRKKCKKRLSTRLHTSHEKPLNYIQAFNTAVLPYRNEDFLRSPYNTDQFYTINQSLLDI
jgi:hypothetical protein